MTPEEKERRRYALLQAAAVIHCGISSDRNSIATAVEIAEYILAEIEAREAK